MAEFDITPSTSTAGPLGFGPSRDDAPPGTGGEHGAGTAGLLGILRRRARWLSLRLRATR